MSQAQAFAEAHSQPVAIYEWPLSAISWREAIQEYRETLAVAVEIASGEWNPDLAGGMTMDELLGMKSEFALAAILHSLANRISPPEPLVTMYGYGTSTNNNTYDPLTYSWVSPPPYTVYGWTNPDRCPACGVMFTGTHMCTSLNAANAQGMVFPVTHS